MVEGFRSRFLKVRKTGGWSAGQLEREIQENSWVITRVKSDTIMSSRGSDSWKRVLRSLKNKYRVWADFPESPDMN